MGKLSINFLVDLPLWILLLFDFTEKEVGDAREQERRATRETWRCKRYKRQRARAFHKNDSILMSTKNGAMLKRQKWLGGHGQELKSENEISSIGTSSQLLVFRHSIALSIIFEFSFRGSGIVSSQFRRKRNITLSTCERLISQIIWIEWSSESKHSMMIVGNSFWIWFM